MPVPTSSALGKATSSTQTSLGGKLSGATAARSTAAEKYQVRVGRGVWGEREGGREKERERERERERQASLSVKLSGVTAARSTAAEKYQVRVGRGMWG